MKLKTGVANILLATIISTPCLAHSQWEQVTFVNPAAASTPAPDEAAIGPAICAESWWYRPRWRFD